MRVVTCLAYPQYLQRVIQSIETDRKHKFKNTTRGEMKKTSKSAISAFIWAVILLIIYTVAAQAQTNKQIAKTSNAMAATATNNPVVGSGTSGQITKWLGADGANTFTIGDSAIFEDKFGKIGIGTKTPASKLTVAGLIESTLGGFKFPDATVQTTAFDPNQVVRSLNGLKGDLTIAPGTNITVTPSGGNTLTIAAPNVLTAVFHDATLAGNGTGVSPLGIANGGVGTTQLANNSVISNKIASAAVNSQHLASNSVIADKIASGQVVKSLNGLTDNVTFAAGSGITLTPAGNTVTIASTAGNPAQSAFQVSVEMNLDPNDSGVGFATVAVPAGKRLVIEYIAIKVFLDGECQPMQITTTVNGVQTRQFMQLPVDSNGFGGALDKQVRIYADSNVTFSAISRSGSDDKKYDITVSGYLIDLQ
jgi:hypothetical protein